MKDYELDLARQELRKQREAAGSGWGPDNKWVDNDTPEIKRRDEELHCIDMINSILAYHYINDAEKLVEREENSWHNYLEKYISILGRDHVVELVKAQINDIDHIEHAVYEDDEGCIYNSIVWKK